MGFPSYLNPQWTRPFGFVYDNGLNFSRSIFNPTSVIRRMLKVVGDSPTPLTKVQILEKMGYRLNRRSVMKIAHFDYDPNTDKYVKTGVNLHPIVSNTPSTTKGYLTWYFGGARKAGFLRPVRQGRTVVWVKGENFPTYIGEEK